MVEGGFVLAKESLLTISVTCLMLAKGEHVVALAEEGTEDY